MKLNSHNFDVKSLYFILHYITTIKKSIVLFALLGRRGIKSSYHNRGTEESPLYVISLLGDLVITYRTNLV